MNSRYFNHVLAHTVFSQFLSSFARAFKAFFKREQSTKKKRHKRQNGSLP